jgi:glycosyltransferase involved in cell wall biosynthesis
VQERFGCGYIWNGWGVLAGKKSGLPVIGELHEYPVYFKDKLLQYLPLRYALKNCDRFLIVSNVIMQRIPVTKDEENKIILMSNGYDASIVSGATSHQVELIKTLLPGKRKVIGYFGALTKDKGVDILLDLICSLENQQFFFILSGHGPLEDKVRAVQSRFPERVKFLGKIPQMDVYSLMSVCDATLALCPDEIRAGCPQFVNPLKVYESLAVGTEVVISEMVKNALPAEIATLCTISKLGPSDILQALEIACNKNSTQLSEKRKVIDNYSWDSIARRILVPLYRQTRVTQGNR